MSRQKHGLRECVLTVVSDDPEESKDQQQESEWKPVEDRRNFPGSIVRTYKHHRLTSRKSRDRQNYYQRRYRPGLRWPFLRFVRRGKVEDGPDEKSQETDRRWQREQDWKNVLH